MGCTLCKLAALAYCVIIINEGSVRYFQEEIIQLQHIHNGYEWSIVNSSH